MNNLKTEKIFVVFLEDLKRIQTVGEQSKLSDENISKLQENYVELLIETLMKGSSFPLYVKHRIMQKVLNKVLLE